MSVAVLCIGGAVKQNVKPATTFRQTFLEKSTTVFAFAGLLLKEGEVGAPFRRVDLNIRSHSNREEEDFICLNLGVAKQSC